MATVENQTISGELSLSEEGKAILEELINNNNNNNNPQNEELTTYGLMLNQVGRTLQLSDTKNWSGSVTGPYPTSLGGDFRTFVHEGVLPKGSKGGLVYTDNRGLKWLVAYHTPGDKVYGEYGRTISSWAVVEQRLDSVQPSARRPTTPPVYANIVNGRLSVSFNNE